MPTKPAPAKSAKHSPAKPSTQTATFGAGCFWGVEVEFRKVPGVLDALSGYAGGHLDKPTYEDICTDSTGHAEVVQVTFDSARVSYEDLLKVFFACHNPTQLNRQGEDIGTQYRSVVFYHSPEQKRLAEKHKAAAAGKWKKPIVTSIEPAPKFWKAEEFHQRYLEKRGMASCHV
jgi:peptide-methionine (S)-S-oxide reductase